MAKQPWYLAEPDLYLSIQKTVGDNFKNLRIQVRDNAVTLIGSFPIYDGAAVVDRYQIEIRFPARFPQELPVVYEVGGRIPKIADRHIYQDGEACLFLPEQLAEVLPDGSSFIDFLNGPVRAYFVSQSYFELTGKWPFGQWGHGEEGLYEFYSSRLKTSDRPILKRYITTIRRKDLRGHWPCPCGSGKRLRNCHLEELRILHDNYLFAMKKKVKGAV